jgi:hypothetical protein
MFRFFAAVLFCGAFLVADQTVRADEPATVIHQDRECTDLGLGMTLCTSMNLVEHTADQPDGDQGHISHADSTYELNGPFGATYIADSQDFHYVTIEELFQEMHLRSQSSSVFPGLACHFETYFHLVDGQIKVDRNVGECHPTL